jgi:uncharacterized phage protein (TIGR01671 family)
MGEIKFRGFDRETKQLIYDIFKIDFFTGYSYYIDGKEEAQRCNNDTLMQFTGLKDKNGNDIYEGDVVKYKDDAGIPQHGIIEYSTYGCRFEAIAIGGDEEGNQNGQLHPDNIFEVIGNIYDHHLINP